MLRKNWRIERKYFPYIVKNATRYNSKHLFLNLAKIPKEDGKGNSRFSFSVPKKVEKSAVKRNKLRRWGYDALLNIKNDIKPGVFCFFIFKRAESKPNFEETRREIAELLSIGSMLR